MILLKSKISFHGCSLKDSLKKICIVSFYILIGNFHVIGQAPNLGATIDFALFTASGAFNNVGASTVVTGNAGTNVGAFNAFPPGILNGSSHVADGITAQAAVDVLNAYTYLDGLTCGLVISTTMGNGQILTPNIYCLGGASTINGNLVLDAQGDPNAIFIFQIDGALSTATLSAVTLINGASLCNVFWQVNGAVALGESSVFEGTMLVQGAISLLQQATLNGRGLSTAGAISLADNIVNIESSFTPIAPEITSSGAVAFCQGDSIILSGNMGGVWSNGLTTSSILVKNSGDYYVVYSNSCGNDTSNHITVTTIVDNIEPEISCPTNIIVSLDPDVCSMNIIFPLATATDNCSNATDITIVSDINSGSNFPVGTTTVTYRATDSAGNTDECTFEVIVSDVQAPEITCPSNITVQLEPLQCEGIATFAPTISDNCPDVFFNYLTEIESGDPFPIGINTVTLLAEDAAGNTAECSFTVTVLDYINPSLGCKPVNFSLDGDCSGSLTPTEVLTGWEGPMGEILLGCLDSFSISITGPNGQNIGNLLTGEYLGKTLDYSITNVNGFTCWNTLLVEDKIAPTIRCRDIAVNCLTDLSKVVVAFPEDNCNARLVLVNEFHALLDCDPDFIGTVTRTYKAVDDYGNESAPCTATIYLRRSTNMGIVPPPANRKLSCSGSYLRDDRGLGYPHPTVTGIPTFEGRALWPQSQLDMQYCNAGIDYKDDILVDTDCKKRIRRTWTVTEWWCSTSVELFLGVQMIDIVDEIAPVIPQVQNYTITTQSRSCTASVTLPTLNITDNCNEVYKVYVNANDGNPTGFVNGNGGILELGVGVHTITYTAFDNCTNSSTMQYRVTVQNNTDPVAVCDQFATVSIKSNGYTEVTAQAVDDGSYDECGEVTLKIRRMEDPCEFGADTAWFDKVGFCCLDANTTRMVQLLVTDKGGNTNICMVSVNVQEKVNPTISCPSDTLIRDCSFTFDPSLSGANNAFGSAVINDNCPANNTLDHVLVDNRNQCGIGTVVRTFSVRQGTTVYQTCTQTITFENDKPFYINRLNPEDPTDDVVWPGVYTAVGQCSPIGLDPAITGRPTFTEDACDLVGMRHEDAVYPFTTNGACYKIIRTWTIIDWCQKDQDGNHLTWTYEQEIKVMDNDAPVITVPSSPVVFETLSCYSDEITLGATAVDCTPASELRWNYIITQGAIEVGSGTTNIVVDSFEVGAYTISFTVEDRCGNQTTASYNFIVETTKAPTAICKKGLAAPLVLMNVGNGSQLMAMIPVEFFDNKSYHTCKYSFELSYTSDVNNDTITFTTPGCKPIQMWVTDQNGNTSYCETFVDVQLNGVDNNCQGSTLLSTVSGRTVKENNEEIEAVTVELLGSEQDPVNTNESGTYVFSPMTHGGTYHIVPFKDGDDMNGVSTLDVVMIQRHILGIEKLKTPYQVIAADANKSESVTAADLTEIRKLILGNIPSFPNNTSWRFVDAGYKFPDATDPWIGKIAERYFVDKLESNMDVNFIGIKTGDVNGSAKGHNVNDETEARTSTRLIIGDQKVMSGEIIEIPVLADENSIVYGLQAQLIANGLIIRDIKEKSIKVEDDNFAIRSSNMANLSISIPNGTRVYKDKVLFVIEAEVLHGGQLSDMIKLGNEMSAEIYTNDLSAQSIAIGWRTDHLSAFALSNVTPNPWNTQTQISFDLPADGMVSFKVKDYTGKKVISTVDQYTAGQNTIQINRSDLGQSGVYVYKLRYEDKVITGKMILIE
jgi:hypothetical protein